MKKILSVSFIAILAVSPMLAEAAAGTKAPAVQPRNEDKVATANYVIGAYNAITDDLAVDNTKTYKVDGFSASNATGKNLEALEAAVGTINTNATNYATQQGVVDTVSNTVNNAKINIYNDWANQGTGTANVYIPNTYTVQYTDSSAQSGNEPAGD